MENEKLNQTIMMHVILPQAFRISIPPMVNSFSAILKDSSLVSILAIAELSRIGQLIYTKTFRDMGEPEGAIIPLFSNRGYMDPLSFPLKNTCVYAMIIIYSSLKSEHMGLRTRVLVCVKCSRLKGQLSNNLQSISLGQCPAE